MECMNNSRRQQMQDRFERILFRVRYLILFVILGVWGNHIYRISGSLGATLVKKVVTWLH